MTDRQTEDDEDLALDGIAGEVAAEALESISRYMLEGLEPEVAARVAELLLLYAGDQEGEDFAFKHLDRIRDQLTEDVATGARQKRHQLHAKTMTYPLRHDEHGGQ